MDTGTFYLYEYENNVRKRNAGFLKIYRRYQSCIFQAHIRSISLENVFEAEMYAFFFKENQICAKQIAHFPIDSMTHSIRFCAPQSSFPECRRLESIDGFFLKCSESSSLWLTPNCPENIDSDQIHFLDTDSTIQSDSYPASLSTRPIVEEAIARTREARIYIMDEVMSKAIAEPRKQVSEYAPKIVQIQIDPEKIGDVVGQRGKTINEIIARTGVKIDITDDGSVSVCGTEAEMMDKAIEMIRIITTDFKEGQILTGTVVSIKEFGAFLEFAPGKEGMVHISKIAKERINHVEDVLTLGDKVKVVCLGKDKMGRISFSIKDVPAEA